MKLYISGILLFLASSLFAQTPVVENVRFEQRTDGTLIVDIYYDVTAVDNDLVEIIIEASDDDGATWTLPCTALDGDVGRVMPGKDKHVLWHFYEDNPGVSGYGYRVRVTALGLCHLFITVDTTLDEDMVCDPQTYYAIIIGAPNVTLDLGGHVISGNGVIAEDVEGITIRNGTIEGSLGAVGLTNTDNATIENLTIRNLTSASPDSMITGIGIHRSKEVVIRDVLIEFLPVIHKEAIVSDRSDITISNIEINGAGVGINFGGDKEFDPEYNRVNGSVLNSKFTDVTVAGILVATTSSAQISGNEFIRNECAISAYGRHPRSITGLTVDENNIHDGNIGIDFWGVTESSITNNIIKDNGHHGINMTVNMYCEFGPPDECFYATGNVIADNVVTGHVMDLIHHEKAVGNTWVGNIFCKKQGDEIPDCNTNITTTAREALFSVNSAAAELATDAQLFTVDNYGPCDTTGKSCNWVYIYLSASQQSNYRFWFKDGQIINQDSVTDNFEGFLPLPETWIDSDSAIVIADGQGGKEFRETFELQNIKMSLMKTAWLAWGVLYLAQDTTFTTSVVLQ